MDQPIRRDGGKPFSAPTVTSIFGLKDVLRIRPHGSTQKPHVVLKRVESSEEVGDDGKKRHIVYYSLYAAKRIEVKPGKEILLAFPDSKFKDQPLVFEGDLADSDSPSDSEEDTSAANVDDSFELTEPMEHAVPPKLRKAWKVQSTGDNHAAHKSPAAVPNPGPPTGPNYASVAVQVQPEYVASATQVQPSLVSRHAQATVSTQSASCQATPSYTSASVQVGPPPVTPLVDKEEQAPRSIDHITAGVPDKSLTAEDTPSVNAVLLDAQRASSPVAGDPDEDEIVSRQRSFSPMELDSPSSTPPHSPTAAISSRASYDSLASSRAGSVPKGQSSHASPTKPPDPHAPVSPYPIPPSPPPLDLLSPPPASSKNLSTDGTLYSPAAVASVNGSGRLLQTFKPLSPLSISDSAATTPRAPAISLGKRGRSPPTGPRSLLGSNARVRTEIPRDIPLSTPQPSISSLGGVPVAPAAMLSALSGGVPPSAPHADTQARTTLSGFKRIAPAATPVDPVSSEWKPNTFTPIAPAPGPLGNPLGIRPSVPPVMRNGVNIRNTVPPKAPAALSAPAQKKPIVVGTGWPPARHYGSVTAPLNSPTPSPSSVTTSVGSFKQVTPPDNVDLPLQTPSPLASKNVAGSAARSGSQLSGIVSYRSPSPEATTRPQKKTTAHSAVSTAVKFISNGLHSSAAPSSSPTPAPMKMGVSGPTQVATPVQVKQEEQPSLPPKPSQLAENYVASVSGAGPSSAEFDHPPGLGSVSKPPSDTSVGNKAVSHPAPVPVKHPLPPKPMAAPGPAPHKYEPNRPVIGVKRSASIATREEPMQPTRKRSFKWPVVECIHSVHVKGDDNVGIRGITFNSNGSQFAVNCQDCTVRIWNNHSHTEVASLKHNAPVVSVAWMDDDAGVVSLGDNGIVSKWTRLGQNKWHWAKILDAGRADEDPTCLAYMRDRIAVAFPRMGVKVWLWVKGTWQPQRSILRQNVTAIRFVEDGDALLGGTTDGVLWYCQVPNGTLRAYSFFKSKVYHLDVNNPGTHALVAQHGGRCHLVGIKEDDHKGKIERAYILKDVELQNGASYDFGAVFTNGDQSVLWGDIHGCVLVWDRMGAEVLCGLDHGDEVVQAVASFGTSVGSSEHHLVTGTKHGQLTWWPHSPSSNDTPRKRMKSADLD